MSISNTLAKLSIQTRRSLSPWQRHATGYLHGATSRQHGIAKVGGCTKINNANMTYQYQRPRTPSSVQVASSFSSNDTTTTTMATGQSWSDEWKALGLGARLPKDDDTRITNLLFVQVGFGVDQHGNDDRNSSGSGGGATKAAVRAVRNAIEFNSIPGVIEAVPGGREEMLISGEYTILILSIMILNRTHDANDIVLHNIKVKLGVPNQRKSTDPMKVNLDEVAKVFPYGRLLPIEVVVGGLSFSTGRIVRELGDEDDLAVCVAASVSIGYDNGKRGLKSHWLHDTKDD